MAQPTTRILAVLELLQTYGRLSGAELSMHLGLDRRTLRRYIVALEELGIPIMTERGRYGGYTLMPGFKLQPMMFNENEAMALAVSLMAANQSGLVQNMLAVSSAQAKLQRIMPNELKQKVQSLKDTISLDLFSSRATQQEDNRFLLELSTATKQENSVEIEYHAANDKSTNRIIDPYGLAFYLGYWYLVGFCRLRKNIRIFRLDRINQVNIVTSIFKRPKDFNVLEYLRTAIAQIPREFSVEVLLHTNLEMAYSYIDQNMGLLIQTDKGVLLHHECSDLSWFARQLALWPFNFEIYQPNQLHLEVKALANRLLECSKS
ncbi:helix-turn-helix transcriptional regulator [Pseudoalteromonas denitrificans]|nr:YafY family protein [Pseudoalteromonas denitrificans]